MTATGRAKTLSAEQMKSAIRRFIEEAVNKGDLSVVDDVYSEDFVDHDLGHPDFGTGTEAVRREVRFYRKGFPDIHQEIHELLADGDVVVNRWTTTGTHLGEFAGMPATGKRMTSRGLTLSRFGPEGKVVEVYNVYDRFAWMQQWGLKGWFWAVVKRSWRYSQTADPTPGRD